MAANEEGQLKLSSAFNLRLLMIIKDKAVTTWHTNSLPTVPWYPESIGRVWFKNITKKMKRYMAFMLPYKNWN